MSAGLCSVAYVIVEPSMTTGSRTPRGAMMPVRPTFHSTSSSRVIFSTAGSLYAIAHRGAREPDPAARRSAARSALTTIPSMPNGSSARSAAISWTRATTCSGVPTTTSGTAVPALVCTPSPAAVSISSLYGSSSSRPASAASVPGRASRP